MANFTQLTTSLAIIAALSDLPSQSDGLSAEAVKAKFDEAAGIIKTFLNSTLIAELEAQGASAKLGAVVGGIASNIQAFINAVEAAGVGSIPPDNSLSIAKFLTGVISTDNTLTSNSDSILSTQKAVKGYIDNSIDGLLEDTTLDTDGTLTANSDAKIATQKATKTYADTKLAKSLITAAGDIIVGSALNTPAILLLGDAGKCPTSTGSTLTYDYPIGRNYIASNDVILTANTERSVSAGTDNVYYTTGKSFYVKHSGIVRLKYEFKCGAGGLARISIDGTNPINETSSSTYTAQSSDIAVTAGTTYTIYLSKYSQPSYIRNVTVCATTGFAYSNAIVD